MTRHISVNKAEQLDSLNEKEVLEGYLFAIRNLSISPEEVSASFWHGYRNGLVDSKRSKLDDAQRELVRDLRNKGKIEAYHAMLEKAMLFVENPYQVMH